MKNIFIRDSLDVFTDLGKLPFKYKITLKPYGLGINDLVVIDKKDSNLRLFLSLIELNNNKHRTI